MKKKSILFSILVIISFIVLGIIVPKVGFQNDTFYTIKIGEYITKHGIDMMDHFSWIANLSYVYPHWLYDVFIYLIYSGFGLTGIYISNMVLYSILLFLMYKYSSKVSNNKYLSFLIVLFIGFTLSGYVTARAQLVTYILLLNIIYSIISLTDKNNKKYYYLMFISSLLIANCHCAIWPFIFVLFVPYIVSSIVYLVCNKFKWNPSKYFNITLNKSYLKSYFKGMLVCLIPGFLTPNFLVPFTYYPKTAMGISTRYISEHLPINISSKPLVFIILLIVVTLLLSKKSKVSLGDLFLFSGLFILAFSSIRNYSLLVIIGCIPFVKMASNNNFFDLSLVMLNKYFYSIFLLIIFIALFVVVKNNKDKEFIDSNYYPVEAADYIVENLDLGNTRIYNEYNYGSYLILRDIPVFIDSRADLYLEEFNDGVTIFDEAMNIYDDYDFVFRRYNATHVLLSDGNKLNTLIKKDSGYKLIYFDAHFNLYEIIYNN